MGVISVVMSFRERTDLMTNMLNSMINNTGDSDNVELLIAIDDDDKKSLEFLNSWNLPFDINIKQFKRSDHFTKDYINPLARIAKGRWIIVVNDDSVFITENWDILLDAQMDYYCKEVGDEFILGLPWDGINSDGFSCWPVVSKTSVDKLGYFLYEKCLIWGPDHLIKQIYDPLERVRRLDILIDHDSCHTGKKPRSENFFRFQRISDSGPKITPTMLYQETKKIEGFINARHKR